MLAKVLNNSKAQRLLTDAPDCRFGFAFTVKAKTVGWNEQKNHSVHCHAAKSAPNLKSTALGEEADRRLMSGDSEAYSDLKSLELFGLGQVWHRNKKKLLYANV